MKRVKGWGGGRTADFAARVAGVRRQRAEGLCTIACRPIVCLSFWCGVPGGWTATQRGACGLWLVACGSGLVVVSAAGLLRAGRHAGVISGCGIRIAV